MPMFKLLHHIRENPHEETLPDMMPDSLGTAVPGIHIGQKPECPIVTLPICIKAEGFIDDGLRPGEVMLTAPAMHVPHQLYPETKGGQPDSFWLGPALILHKVITPSFPI